MSGAETKLAEERRKLASSKEKHQLLKSRHEQLKERHARLKEQRTQLEQRCAALEAEIAALAAVPPVTLEESKDFVRQCYRDLLGREPSPEELDHPEGFPAVLAAGQWTREQVMWEIIHGEEYRQRHQPPAALEFVPTGHFYSAVPSDADRQRALLRSPLQKGAGIDMRPEDQQKLLQAFVQDRAASLLSPEAPPGRRFRSPNDQFEDLDAFLLESVIRHFQPTCVIEVGSGYSSALMLDLCDELPALGLDLTFIEPHAAQLRELLKPEDATRVRLIEEPVQSVDLEVFRALKPGDVLFIDSTHVSKCGSDVNYLFFEVLPTLADGVIIHVHDIFYPWEYRGDWIAGGRAWNELYLLRAFLMHNNQYQVLIAASYVQKHFRPWLREHLPEFAHHPGGSFWMRKGV